MVKGMKRQSGLWLGLTGWFHTTVGLVLFWEPLKAITGDGFFNAVGIDYERNTAVWFLFAGLFMILLGYLMGWVIKTKGIELPKMAGVFFLSICLIGVILMPDSGFWLGFPQAYIIISKSV